MELKRLGTALLIVVWLAGSSAAQGHDHSQSLKGQNAGELGSVNFPVSCTATAQTTFSRSVAMLHSFWYEEAAKSFESVAQQDPTCAMAWWGVAMSNYHPLWEPPTAAAMAKGTAAIHKAKALNARTDRERGYIRALSAFYQADAKLDYTSRNRAYSHAMARVYRANPDDSEAAVFYALSLVASASRTDKTYANQRRAGAILEKVFATQPNHPGVIHYLIHSYDYPTLASYGLDAARRYAKTAPAVPHALHMPSHIFVRLGLWEDAANSNRAAIDAGKKYEQETHMSGAWDQRLHPADYLVYSLLQSGRDLEARAVVEEISHIQKAQPDNLTGGYVLAVVPVRYAMERSKWAAAARLSPRPSTFPYTQALTYWARAMGSARTGYVAAARENLRHLESIEKQLRDSKEEYWANQSEVLVREASAWIGQAVVEKNNKVQQDKIVQLMRSAADLEDSIDKHPITPGAVLPARELLGNLLLEMHLLAQASEAFEASLRSAPNRFNSLFGAAKAAELGGDSARARQYYSKLIENCSTAQANRSQLAEAKMYLARR